MKIKITVDVIDEEMLDDTDPSGLTAEAYEQLQLAVMNFGDDVEIERT